MLLGTGALECSALSAANSLANLLVEYVGNVIPRQLQLAGDLLSGWSTPSQAAEKRLIFVFLDL
jgi:hypothetical protein